MLVLFQFSLGIADVVLMPAHLASVATPVDCRSRVDGVCPLSTELFPAVRTDSFEGSQYIPTNAAESESLLV
jgi:hypothetical protein